MGRGPLGRKEVPWYQPTGPSVQAASRNKWVGWENPEWTNAENLEEIKALDKWEVKYGPIGQNNGPLDKYVAIKRRR